MKPLKDKFSKNGLPYTLLHRNKVAAVYGVGGTFTDKILHYEVCRIYFNEEHTREDVVIPASESIASNEVFGNDYSFAIKGYKKAMEYYEWLTTYLKMTPTAKKSVRSFVLNPLLD